MTGASSDFHESWSRQALSPHYSAPLAQLLPSGWHIHRRDMWLHALREPKPPSIGQGFKIHVSATPYSALRTMELVVPECVARGIEFKVVGDPTLHSVLDGKRQARGSSGKFMTIYPLDVESFRELIEALHRKTKDEPVAGPRVLSDRRYRDSRLLSYRYGGFYPPSRVRLDGTHEMLLVSPDGALIADERLPYFKLPDWVEDPFDPPQPPTAVDREDGSDILLDGRYRVDAAFDFSNAGGVYYGTDIDTGAPVFIKEGRPLTDCWTRSGLTWDSTDTLRHEFAVLERLGPLPWVPSPLDCFEDAEHTFLVQDRVTGMSLRKYWAREDVLLAPFIRTPGRIETWLPLFRTVAATLINMVREVHRLGVLLGDLSPDNVLIEPETLRMWLVDFESAVMDDAHPVHQARAALWGTPGFMRPERSADRSLEPADDFYAAGMILYSGLCSVTGLFGLAPSARELFLDEFVSLGLPPAVRTVIVSLLREAPDRATEALESFSSDPS